MASTPKVEEIVKYLRHLGPYKLLTLSEDGLEGCLWYHAKTGYCHSVVAWKFKKQNVSRGKSPKKCHFAKPKFTHYMMLITLAHVKIWTRWFQVHIWIDNWLFIDNVFLSLVLMTLFSVFRIWRPKMTDEDERNIDIATFG